MDKETLFKVLGKFFFDSLRDDPGDVGWWCEHNDISPDDILTGLAEE